MNGAVKKAQDLSVNGNMSMTVAARFTFVPLTHPLDAGMIHPSCNRAGILCPLNLDSALGQKKVDVIIWNTRGFKFTRYFIIFKLVVFSISCIIS
jgi:hypothetical protein